LTQVFDLCISSRLDNLVDMMRRFAAESAVICGATPEVADVLEDAGRYFPSARLVLVVEPAAQRLPSFNRLAEAAHAVVTRPLEAQELLQALSPGARSREPRGTEIEPLLVVASDAPDMSSMLEMLCGGGFRMVVTDGEEAALEYCERVPQVPVCILDVENPDVDWTTFALQLHSRSTCEFLPIAAREAQEEVPPPLRHRTSDFVVRPFSAETLVAGVQHLLERWRERQEPETHPGSGRAVMLKTRNEAMQRVLERLDNVAPTEATVLLRGETGTGKEVLARLLHSSSRRRSGPFFSINCGALNESLLDSELFGHERGAFTGAVRRKRGLFELASTGTLFLDEIGELSSAMQVKILRVLQEREFLRVGGEEVLHCDVRVVAATHRDLEKMMQEGRFRPDLYYRIQVVPLYIPPLRERLEDLPELATFILSRHATEHHRPVPRISPEAMDDLLRYPWPGNVRELENVLERALLLSAEGLIRRSDIECRDGMAATPTEDKPLAATKEHMERDYLVRLLVRHSGNVKAAADAAAVGRRTLYRHLHALQIDPRRFRTQT
jgi:DNA-binding NtrC family response regulator